MESSNESQEYIKTEVIAHSSTETNFETTEFKYKPKISVIMPVYNTKADILAAAVRSVEVQSYPNWELCMCDDASTYQETKDLLEYFKKKDDRIKIASFITNQGISKATNGALSLATGEYIVLLDHDDELAPDTLFEIVKVLNSNPVIDFIYSDEDKIDRIGKYVEPFFKPDFSLHLLRSQNYLIHVAVIKRQLVLDVGGFDKEFDGAQDYDLFFRVLEKTDKVYHIRKILYHWRKSPESGAENALAKPWIYETGKRAIQNHLKRLGLNATAEIGQAYGQYRVNYVIDDSPYVDILIPTRKVSFIKDCVKSILDKTTWKNYKIWAIINGKEDYEIVQIKTNDCIELEPYTDPATGLIGPSLPYNWSRMNNIAASATKAPFMVLLNDDTTIITEDWIENMLQYAQQEDIGGIGVMLLYPDNVIQHAGDFISESKMGDHCFNCMAKNSFEVNGLAQVVRETSAVTSACMMIRREVFDKLGGFDEKLRNFDDYDFCLRLRENGYKIIYTPYTKIYHHESPTRPQISDKQLITHLLEKHTSIAYEPFYRYEWRSLYDKTLASHKKRTLVEIVENEKSDPVTLVLALYVVRKDLQKAFPEVIDHDYRRLLKWARDTVKEKTGDYSTRTLLRFAEWYDNITKPLDEIVENEKSDPLTVILGLYLMRKDLQKAFPEVIDHDYRRLLKWAKKLSRGESNDKSANVLRKFADWYNQATEDKNLHVNSIPTNGTIAVYLELFRLSRSGESDKL